MRAATFTLLFTLLACSDAESTRQHVSHEADLELTEATWTYFSMEANAVVTTIAFADTTAQAKMAQRTDWDVAFAPGGLIRTNSGSSASAIGGMRISDIDYESTDASADIDLVPDTAQFDVY